MTRGDKITNEGKSFPVHARSVPCFLTERRITLVDHSKEFGGRYLRCPQNCDIFPFDLGAKDYGSLSRPPAEPTLGNFRSLYGVIGCFCGGILKEVESSSDILPNNPSGDVSFSADTR